MGNKVDFVCLAATVPGRHSGGQVHKVKKHAAPLVGMVYLCLLYYCNRYSAEDVVGSEDASRPPAFDLQAIVYVAMKGKLST